VKRLTDEQRDRAAGSYHLAEACARRAMRPGLDYGVLLSQASLGLLHAAANWDRVESEKSGRDWVPFAAQRIRWMLLRLWGRGAYRLWLEPCGRQVPDFVLESAPGRGGADPAWEAAEEVAAGLAWVSPGERELLLGVHARGRTQLEMAREAGVSRGAITLRLRGAERAFREARAGGGGGRQGGRDGRV
jgi:hypothetical protein